MNWNDLKYLIAVHRKGTLSGASGELGVNQTTVTRRLQKLDQALRVSLLKRSAGTLALTKEGLRVLKSAEIAEEEFFKLEKSLELDQQAKGFVKITAVDSLINEILLPALPELTRQHPGLKVNFMGANTNLEIARFEADIAVRLARPQSGTMIVSKLSDIGFALYGTLDMQIRTREQGLQAVPWAAYDEQLALIPEMQWLAASYPDVTIALRSHSAATLAEALRRNIAIGILPCFLGEATPGLVRLSGNHPVLTREAWLVTHQDVYKTPRLRAAISWLKDIFVVRNAEMNGNISKEYPETS